MVWYKKHKKILSLSLGILFLLFAVVLYWKSAQSGVTASETKSHVKVVNNIIIPGSSKTQAKVKPDISILSQKLKASHQAKTLLVVLLFIAFGAIMYALFSKTEVEDEK